MEHVFCKNPLSYEEILNWRGFSFETSHVMDKTPLTTLIDLINEVEHMTYGIEESERIINNVLTKQKGF